jgi:hypothetical protein
MKIYKKWLYIVAWILTVALLGCSDNNDNNEIKGGDDPEFPTPPKPPIPGSVITENWLPYISKLPAYYWDCTGILYNAEKNRINFTESSKGLQNYLLAHSLMGLTLRAVQNNESNVGIWMGNQQHPEIGGYLQSRNALSNMGIINLGEINAFDLATKSQATYNGKDVSLNDKFKKYVLIDVNKPESTIVAPTASHVYDALIVDVRDKAAFDKAGYEMVYDARDKTTVMAWREFKDYCSNAALVLIPVQTGELREFAIANNLFTININKIYNSGSAGSNFLLFEEVLAWLAPNAPVYGWDQGIDESMIAEYISRYGKHAVPYDWCYNTSMTSLQYPSRQTYAKAKTIDPKAIDYTIDKKFVSFYLSDGDNIQWMMGDFDRWWYSQSKSEKVKMTYGVGVGNLAMISPAQMELIFAKQSQDVSIFERGSYYFVDVYGNRSNRNAELQQMAEFQAKQMKSTGVKILGLVSRVDADSPESMKAFQAMIEANDELEGILMIQYSPYADGKGRTWWFKNSKGWDIPVICTKYSVWNCGTSNHAFEGTPAYIASKLKAETGDDALFSSICVHAWSKFYDKGLTSDMTIENVQNPDNIAWTDSNIVFSAGAAELTLNHLGGDYRAVNSQELIWRVRMKHNPAQTQQILNGM